MSSAAILIFLDFEVVTVLHVFETLNGITDSKTVKNINDKVYCIFLLNLLNI